MAEQQMKPFELLGYSTAWLIGALVGMPILNVAFGALGGLIVQMFVGHWVVAGASQLGLKLDGSMLWQLSACLAFLGSYFRVPARATSKSN